MPRGVRLWAVGYEVNVGSVGRKTRERQIKLKYKIQTSNLNADFVHVDGTDIIFRLPITNQRVSMAYETFLTLGPANTTFNAEGIYVNAIGMRGTIMAAKSEDIDANPNRVSLTVVEMKELNPNDTVLRSSQFTDLRFIFDDAKEANVSEYEIPASMLKGSVSVMGGMFEVYVYIFKEDRLITVTGDNGTATNIPVMKGDLKVELQLKGYTMDDDSVLDVIVQIKGPDVTPTLLTRGVMATDDEAYDLGNNLLLLFSKKISIDSESYDMVRNYPKLDSDGNFIFRFPNFNSKNLTYGPTIGMRNLTVIPTTTSTTTTTSITTSITTSTIYNYDNGAAMLMIDGLVYSVLFLSRLLQ